MTTIFFKEDQFFITEEEAKAFAKRFTNKSVDTISTDKNFAMFIAEFETAREEGCSIADAIEWAR